MPKKIRELKRLLIQAGFREIQGKDSHIHYVHPNYSWENNPCREGRG